MRSHLSTIIVGVVQFAFVMASSLRMDKLGRKWLASFVMAFSHVGMGIYYYFLERQQDMERLTEFSRLPVLFLCLFVGGYSLGMITVVLVLVSEVILIQTRNEGTSVALSLNALFVFGVVQLFPVL